MITGRPPAGSNGNGFARPAAPSRIAMIKARTSLLPAEIAFEGNSWRGRIGDEFTVANVHKVVRAIIRAMGENVFFKTTWCTSFLEVQYGGMLILDDGKPLSIEFANAAIQEVAGAQMYMHRTDMSPNGSLSAILRRLWAVGALSFTQAGEVAAMHVHPAYSEVPTDDFFAAVQQYANRLMDPRLPFDPTTASPDLIGARTHFFHPSDVLSSGAG
jgi:hypothetical protein